MKGYPFCSLDKEWSREEARTSECHIPCLNGVGKVDAAVFATVVGAGLQL